MSPSQSGRRWITVLDDYQEVALTSTDWSALAAEFDVQVIAEHLENLDLVVERLRDSEVVVAMRERTPLPRQLLEQLPTLRLLVTTGMANAAIDLDAAAELGITVCGTRGRPSSVPELTFGMMIALARGFAAEDAAVRSGGWQHTIGPGLAGRTLGLIGLGKLGAAMVPVAHAFDMSVTAWSPHLDEERASALAVRAVSREELFSGADYVSIHMVLAEATRGLVDATDFARMKPSAYLVNTSRGPVVDEDALLAALTGGSIAGAALDVYGTEPLPPDDPWRHAPRTLLLPHLGYVTTEGYETYFRDVVEDVASFRAGCPVRVLSRPVEGPG